MRPEARTEESRRAQAQTGDAAPPPGLRIASEVPRPGTRVAGLEVLSELGRGAFGVVLRARDPALGRDVALKVMLDRGSPEQLRRFEREGRLLASLDAPGILRVHGAGVADGRPYLVVELIEGARELDRYARPLPLARRVALVRDAARALGGAHARGVVHRDVKPANLLVDAEGRVRVADFGLAVGVDVERLTHSGVVLGTLLYMAPEQVTAERGALGPPTDVFALGAVLYELACGQAPFDGATQGEVMRRIATGSLEPPRSLAPEVSPALERVLLRALAHAPDDRYPDGEALAAALDAVLAGPGATATGAGSRRLLLAGLPLAAVVALGAVALLYQPAAREPPPSAPARPTRPAATPGSEPPDGASGALRARAAAGDLRAMRELGRILVDGRGGEVRAGLEWLERAGSRGDAASSREVGLLLLEGRPDLPRAPARALPWLRRAASDGPDPVAMTALFDAVQRLTPLELDEATPVYLAHHTRGDAFPANDPVVCGMLLAARDRAGDGTLAYACFANMDDAVAKLQLAELVVAGRADEPTIGELLEGLVRAGKLPWPERALELLDRLHLAAEDVSSIGQPQFGRSERMQAAREHAVAGDDVARVRVLEEAAALGSSEAMFLLIRKELEGRQLSREVLTLLTRSADLGYQRACEELGHILHEGVRAPRDLARAIVHLRRAVVAAGPAAAPQNRGRLGAALLDASGGADPEGFALLKQAAEEGDEAALLTLAERLVDGRLPRDLAWALSLIEGRAFRPKQAARVEAIRAAIRDLAHPPGEAPPR